MSTRSAKYFTASIMSRSVAALAKAIAAPGARSWTISIIAVPSAPAFNPSAAKAR